MEVVPESGEPKVVAQAVSGKFDGPVDFIKHYRRVDLSEDLDEVMKQYANEIDYFGETRSVLWVKAEKEAFREKWPVRSEEISSIVNEKMTGRKEWSVSFNTTFRNENPKKKLWYKGTLSNAYTIVQRNQRFYVIKQSAERISSQKKTRYDASGKVIADEEEAGGSNTTVTVSSNPKKSKHPRLTKIVNLMRKVRESEKERYIEGVVSGYAPSVDYFGKMMTREEIREEKLDFYLRWPVSEEERTSGVNVMAHGEDSLKVTFTSSFKYSNELEGRWRSGVFANTYIVSDASGEMLIIGQSAEISDLKKSAE